MANYNNDGFDIEAKNVLIEDCDIDVEDDAICGKIHDPAFVSENVVARPTIGNCVMQRAFLPILPSNSARYISVDATWFRPIPSPII